MKKEKKYYKIQFTREELNWIERTADIESARVFMQFNNIIELLGKENLNIDKTLFTNQIEELTQLYSFLKTLRAKLELWDCRYDLNKTIEGIKTK